MTTERWRQIEAVFERASELSVDARDAFLAAECRGDRELRDEVVSLLASASEADGALRQAISAAVESMSHAAAASAVGMRLGPYRLASVIGEGGMGTVYLAARDDGLYRGDVAIKILRHELASPQVVARFRDERQILASLDHPAIVRLLDGGNTDAGLPYLVMEHVDGVPFAAYVRGLAVRARVRLVVRVAAAVQYAHQQLIVHRDLKPSNILVDASGSPKLLDFGIAKLLATAPEQRNAHTIAGVPLLTPEYASPEQARGEPVTVASDVYSLGAVLYQALVGEPPQRAGASLLETVRNICDAEPRLPSSASTTAPRAQLAGDLDSIVLKALQKRPEQRYASIAAFVDDLERYLTGLPVAARDATLVYRARKLIARHRGKLALLVAVTTALATATAISIRQARRADAQAERAERDNLALLRERGLQELDAGHAGRALPFLVEALRADPSSAALRFSIAEALRPFDRAVATLAAPEGVTGVAISADARAIAVTGQTGIVRVFDAKTGRAISVSSSGTNAPIGAPAFASDGSRLVTSTEAGQILVWNVAAGRIERTLVGHHAHGCIAGASAITDLAVTGPRVVAAGCDGRILAWQLDTGELVRSIDVQPLGETFAFAVSPDGSLYAAGLANGTVRVFDAVTGQPRAELVGHARVNAMRFTSDGKLLSRGDSTARVWDAARGTQLALVGGHGGAVGGVDIDRDMRRAVTVATDGTVRIWDVATGTIVTQLAGHAHGTLDARFSSDGRRVITAGFDLAFRVWDAASGAQELALDGDIAGGTGPHALGQAFGAGFVGDGALAWTGSGASVKLWRIDEAPLLATLPAGAVLAESLSPDERRLALAGPDGVAIWDLERRAIVRSFGPRRVWDVEWTRDGSHLAIAAENGIARIYDAEGHELRELAGHTGTINRSALSPDDTLVVTAGADHTARIWDIATGRELARLAHPDGVMSTAWSSDGTRIATSCWDGKLRIWNATTHALVLAIDDAPTNLLDVSFAPDGTRLASTGHGGEIDIWNATTGAHELALVGHGAPVTTAAWSPDGSLIASSSSDGTLRIWDARTGAQLAVRHHGGEIMQALWSRDGTRVLSVSATQGARVWDVRRDLRPLALITVDAALRSPFRLENGRLKLMH